MFILLYVFFITVNRLNLIFSNEVDVPAAICDPQILRECVDTKFYHFETCQDVYDKYGQVGFHRFYIRGFGLKPFLAECADDDTFAFTVILRATKTKSFCFKPSSGAYKSGFGNLNDEFFIGLEKLHALTTRDPQILMINIQLEKETVYSFYEYFAISSEREGFILNLLTGYQGNAGDFLKYHIGNNFIGSDDAECILWFQEYHKVHPQITSFEMFIRDTKDYEFDSGDIPLPDYGASNDDDY